MASQELSQGPQKGAMRILMDNPYLFGLCSVRLAPKTELACAFHIHF